MGSILEYYHNPTGISIRLSFHGIYGKCFKINLKTISRNKNKNWKALILRTFQSKFLSWQNSFSLLADFRFRSMSSSFFPPFSFPFPIFYRKNKTKKVRKLFPLFLHFFLKSYQKKNHKKEEDAHFIRVLTKKRKRCEAVFLPSLFVCFSYLKVKKRPWKEEEEEPLACKVWYLFYSKSSIIQRKPNFDY